MRTANILVIPACILIIDDDEDRIRALRERLQKAFRENDEVLALGSVEWLSHKQDLVEHSPLRTVLVGRWRGWEQSGIREKLAEAYPDIPFYFIDDDSERDEGGPEIELFETNPVNERLRKILHEISSPGGEAVRPARTDAGKPAWLFRGLSGESGAIQSVKNDISLVGAGDSTVLITGSSGTGKEIVARNIHFQSPRRLKPFVPLKCGMVATDLLERELFGYAKGAFPGAAEDRKGRFELADGGTLFLDDIGDMPLAMQVKLLKVLQERTFERVGGGTPRDVNVRIIAATHLGLHQLVAESKFREDLFHRLSAFPIHVPDLKDRIEDLPVLIEEIQRKRRDSDRPGIRFSPRAVDALERYLWPGNLRELSELVEKLAGLYLDREIGIDDLPGEYRQQRAALPPGSEETRASRFHPDGLDLRRYLGDMERLLIRQALEETGGTVSRAADLLKMSKTLLAQKMRKHRISAADIKAGRPAGSG